MAGGRTPSTVELSAADIGGVEAGPHEPVSPCYYSPSLGSLFCGLSGLCLGLSGGSWLFGPKYFDTWGSPRKTWDCDTPRISTEPLTRHPIPKFSLIASFSALARAEIANCGASVDQINSLACRVPNPAVGLPRDARAISNTTPIYSVYAEPSLHLLHTQARRGSISRMASSPESSPLKGPMSVNGGYKRASRKGAPRRFPCEHPGCDKIYSRAEHLQRHQLNRETFPRLNPQLCLHSFRGVKRMNAIFFFGLWMYYCWSHETFTDSQQTIQRKYFDVTLGTATKSLFAWTCCRVTRSVTPLLIRLGIEFQALIQSETPRRYQTGQRHIIMEPVDTPSVIIRLQRDPMMRPFC